MPRNGQFHHTPNFRLSHLKKSITIKPLVDYSSQPLQPPYPTAMDQTWASYAESPTTSRQARYNPNSLSTPQQPARDPNGLSGMKQDPYSSSISSRAASMAISSPAAPDLRNMQYNGDRDGDVPMEDADQYKPKFPTRPTHQSRNSAQFIQQQEESAAARRYSPMNLSPSSPYTQTPQQPIPGSFGAYTPQQQSQHSNRQSPTRSTNPYMSPPQSYYSPTSALNETG